MEQDQFFGGPFALRILRPALLSAERLEKKRGQQLVASVDALVSGTWTIGQVSLWSLLASLPSRMAVAG
jgi:hypothetical protein